MRYIVHSLHSRQIRAYRVAILAVLNKRAEASDVLWVAQMRYYETQRMFGKIVISQS